jgi:hypothetical protein
VARSHGAGSSGSCQCVGLGSVCCVESVEYAEGVGIRCGEGVSASLSIGAGSGSSLNSAV